MAIKVGVLMGGPSAEHQVSLKTGKAVLDNLPERYLGRDIVITENGEWIFEEKFSTPEKIFRSVDVIFNALHGHFGEDGKVQQIFESFNIPYTGSGVFSSVLGMNKVLSREYFKKSGLNTPKYVVLDQDSEPTKAARKVLTVMSPPWVVKPIAGGSSFGVLVAHNARDLMEAIADRDKIIVEEYIKGREATCEIIDGFREQKYYSLPVAGIMGERGLKEKIEETGRLAHSALGCRHYSRSNFIISPQGKIYILEINTTPKLSEDSVLRKSLEAVGSSSSEFLDHLIKLALWT